MGDTLLLVDGHALVYRAFFAMPALTNGRGELTNAAFGFTSMLLKAFEEHKPTHAVAAFDPPGPTFRHEQAPTYKAQRPDMPDDLRKQFPWCRDIAAVFNMPLLELSGFEADDAIGTLSRQGEAAGVDVLILTGDLDALQLVTPHVSVYTSRKGLTDTVVYDVDKVRERFGFDPSYVVDYKGLCGDTSDNIPGVPGIGAKTAASLIQQYGTLEEILAAVPSMKEGRVKQALITNEEQARQSKDMATIRCDIDVTLDLSASRLSDYDHARAQTLLEELGFRALVPRLPKFGPQSADAVSAAVVTAVRDVPSATILLREKKETERACADLRSAKRIALTTVIDDTQRPGQIVGVALCSFADDASRYYLPINHASDNATAEAITAIEVLLADAGVAKVGYDLKRDVVAWQRRGCILAGLEEDVMLAAYLCNTRIRVPSLAALAIEFSLDGMLADVENTAATRTRERLQDVDVERAAALHGDAVGVIPEVARALDIKLKEWDARRLHDELELPLVDILARMELEGIAVDVAQLQLLSTELYTRIGEIEQQVGDHVGTTFNLGSTQQLAKVLYDDLGLAAGRKTKSGRSTDAATLEFLRNEHPVVELILEWRQLTKLKGTYVDALPLLCDAQGRIHTSFNQAVAATGRLSSSDPNLQNIPVRTEWGQRIRKTFVASPMCVLVSADYSQIELRVLAHVTGETALIDAFHRGEDIHQRTAALVHGVDAEAVTPQMRRIAKVVNFGVLYGLSEFGLARDTGMSNEEARAFITAYFEQLPAVTEYLESVRRQCRETGYVETLLGRRRYVPDIRAGNRQMRMAAERIAVNMPLQGTAADIMKQGMINVDKSLREHKGRAKLLLQVHDELVLDVPFDEVEKVKDLVRTAMSSAAELVVPLVVDVKSGRNWSEMTPLSESASTRA